MIKDACIVGRPGASAGLCVGPLSLDGRVVLAPMAGVTDIGMRRVARATGASLVVSEMVAAEQLARGERVSRARAEGAGLDLHVVQIAGRNPADMAEAARCAESAGSALVDINMGCPARKVTGGYGGSALMRDLDLATQIIRAVVAAVRVPVSVKMRLGWDDADAAPRLAARAAAEGVALLTVHGRTRCQFYTGRADWAAVGAVKRTVDIPVIVNGDCAGVADARAMLAASGADGVMIGRAAIGQPWLVGAVATALRTGTTPAPLSPSRRLGLALDHYDTILADMGVAAGVRHARKHLSAYARHAGAGDDDPRRAALVRSETPKEVRGLLSEIFANAPQAVAA